MRKVVRCQNHMLLTGYRSLQLIIGRPILGEPGAFEIGKHLVMQDMPNPGLENQPRALVVTIKELCRFGRPEKQLLFSLRSKAVQRHTRGQEQLRNPPDVAYQTFSGVKHKQRCSSKPRDVVDRLCCHGGHSPIQDVPVGYRTGGWPTYQPFLVACYFVVLHSIVFTLRRDDRELLFKLLYPGRQFRVLSDLGLDVFALRRDNGQLLLKLPYSGPQFRTLFELLDPRNLLGGPLG